MSEFLTGVEKNYPKELLSGRVPVEGNVISCLFKDMLLLDEVALTNKDFITRDSLFYYEMLSKLRKAGITSLDEISIITNLNEDEQKIFEDLGGYDTIQNQIDIINEKNFDTYIDILYRENIMLKMSADGIDLTHRVKLDNGRPIQLVKLFRKMDAEGVSEWFEARVAGYGTGYSKSVLEEDMIDFEDDYLDICAEGESSGVPFDIAGYDKNGEEINCYSFLSRQVGGLLPGTFTMMAGYSSVGKSSWYITLIYALLYRDRKVLIISNEEQKVKFKAKFLVWLLGKYRRYFKLTKKKLSSGEITGDDKEEYKLIQKFWRENYSERVKFIGINDANITVVKKKIRENVLKYGFDTVLYDTFKIQESDYAKNRTDLALVKDSRELDKIAKKYDIIMLASCQLAEHTKGSLFLAADCLSNSKQIKEILENLFIMRNVYPEELDPNNKKYYCKPFRLTKVNDKWIEQPYECDTTAIWRMLFVEKCRGGSNSPDTGNAYLLRFDGDHCIFRETCQCKPKHGTIGR